MKIGRQITLTISFVALSLWIAAVIAPAVSAMATFGTLPDLDVSLREYESFTIQGEPDAHARLAAGMVLEKIFTGSDFAQVALAFLVIVTLAIDVMVFRQPVRRPANAIRIVSALIATGLLAFHVFLQAPQMNRELRQYWGEARAGNVEAALEHRERFDRYHPRAEMILQANLVLLLITMGAFAAAVVPNDRMRADLSP